MITPKNRDSNNPYEIDHVMAGLVPMASEAEQSSLTEDIKMNGLREPVVLWRGKIIDGRCRQKACQQTGQRIWSKEIDKDTSESDVRILVKSLNTRRNLTPTQKVISACKASLDKNNSYSIKHVAESWGISKRILENARYIAKARPEYINPLFDGQSVDIVGSNGKETTSVKVTAIYAYLKRLEERVTEDTQHGWAEESIIKTQAGKDWYYEQIKQADLVGEVKYKMLVAELANYKF